MKELEIYIHIPFCVKKCNYCDFLSFPAKKELQLAYCRALILEMNAFFHSEEYLSNDYQISTIFIGGGTPSILEADRIQEILSCIPKNKKCFEKEREITIEANPDSLSIKKLRAYQQAGINRLSIGLQSSNNKELAILGRVHTWEQFLEGYHQARSAGFDNINIDLISGLPEQTIERWEKVLLDITTLSPEHISAYSLILEEGTPFYDWYGQPFDTVKNRKQLPSEEETARMYELTETILSNYGYWQYEISNYSKKGMECRHNLGYWYRTEYIGFGLGAASLLSEVRFQNSKNILEYLSITNISNKEKILQKIHQKQEILTRKDQIEETMFLGLRCRKGVLASDFFMKFGEKLTDIKNYKDIINKYAAQGFLDWNGEYLRLTKKALLVSNQIMQEFLLD